MDTGMDRLIRKIASFPLPFLLLLLVFALSVSSCAQPSLLPDGGPTAATKAASPPRVVLEFWHTYSDSETGVFESKVLPLFEAAYPRIAIHAVRKDYTPQLKDHIFASVADNKQPDVMRMDIVWVPEFARNGSLDAVSGLDGFEELRDRFIGALINTNLYEGNYYGLPVNANTKAAIYNRTLLRKAGLSEPPRTFAELEAAVGRLRKTEPDARGIGICCSSGWGTLPYFWTFGGKLTDEAFTRASGYLDHPDSLAALRKLQRLFSDGVISPSIVGGEPGNWDGVLQGKILMIEEAHWFYTVNATGANKDQLADTIVAPFPDDAAHGTSIIGGENLVLFKGSKHPHEAWTFMKWMATAEPQTLMAQTGLIPTLRDMPDSGRDFPFEAYLRQLDRALPRPPVARWTDIDNVFARMIELILTGEQPLETAVGDAVAEIDRLLRGQ